MASWDGGYGQEMREREIKFLVGSGGAVPAPAELFRGLGSVAVDEVDQDAIYFDTPDLRLTRAGASLRHRSDDGWTVKLPQSVSSTIVRDELSFAGDNTKEPPDDSAGIRACNRPVRTRAPGCADQDPPAAAPTPGPSRTAGR